MTRWRDCSGAGWMGAAAAPPPASTPRARRGGRAAQQLRRDGAWRTLTWKDVGDSVRELASGLIALGRKKGDAVGILSGSRAEWVQADFAIFSAGGITIP